MPRLACPTVLVPTLCAEAGSGAQGYKGLFKQSLISGNNVASPRRPAGEGGPVDLFHGVFLGPAVKDRFIFCRRDGDVASLRVSLDTVGSGDAAISGDGGAGRRNAAKPSAMNLSGVWEGTYSYPDGSGRDPVPFELLLIHKEGDNSFRGEIKEPRTFGDDNGPWLHAEVVGTYHPEGHSITFKKQYDGTNGVNHAVLYSGDVTQDGTQINGTWKVSDDTSGKFTMSMSESRRGTATCAVCTSLAWPVRLAPMQFAHVRPVREAESADCHQRNPCRTSRPTAVSPCPRFRLRLKSIVGRGAGRATAATRRAGWSGSVPHGSAPVVKAVAGGPAGSVRPRRTAADPRRRQLGNPR